MRDDGLSFFALNRAGLFVSEFTTAVTRYQHEYMEGPYRAEFDLVVGEGATDKLIDEWFNSRLTLPIEVHKEGVLVWRGFVYEMEHYRRGVLRKKTCDGLANVVKVQFNDEFHDGETRYSEWYKNQASIDLYGSWESIVQHEGGNSWVYDADRDGPAIDPDTGEGVTEIDERADVELQYRSDPFMVGGITFVGDDGERSAGLHVTCVGTMVLAETVMLSNGELPDRYTSEGELKDPYSGLRYTGVPKWNDYEWGDEIEVGDEIQRIVDVLRAAGIPVYPLRIAANDIPTAAGVSSPTSAYKRLVDLAKLRNSKKQFYRLEFLPDGGVIYDVIPDKPAADYVFYASSDRPRVLLPDGKTVPTWEARPGYVRVIDDQSNLGLPGTWLSDSELQFIERTSMREGDESASFHSREFDIGDLYAMQYANLNWIESAASAKEASDGSGEKPKAGGGSLWTGDSSWWEDFLG